MAHLTQISTPGQTRPTQENRPTAAAALEAGAQPSTRPAVRSLYVHIPFCFHKCHYCDFYSIVDTQDRQGGFTDRLIAELEQLSRHLGTGSDALRTIFVGGGTPTLLRLELWERLLGAMERVLDLSLIRSGSGSGAAAEGGQAGGRGGQAEWTVECNPETVTPELMAMLAAAGVNRVSIGAQSFQARHLKTLERWHDPENVQRAVELARAAGIGRQSIDLIYAIPGQTLEECVEDVQRAVSLGTSHLSCYSLTYEPNTAMTARLKAGQFQAVDEDLEAEMFFAVHRTLREAGFERYEVSNFARSVEDRSRHNLAYWRQEQWLAAGPSASGHVHAGGDPAAGGYRWKNVPRLGDYLDSEGYSPVVDLELPDPARALRERLMMGLRTVEGVDAAAVTAHASVVSPALPERLSLLVQRFRDEGLLQHDPERWRLTDRAFSIADFIASRFMREIPGAA